MMYKSQFRKMDPYGFVVQGHILCLIYQNIISTRSTNLYSNPSVVFTFRLKSTTRGMRVSEERV